MKQEPEHVIYPFVLKDEHAEETFMIFKSMMVCAVESVVHIFEPFRYHILGVCTFKRSQYVTIPTVVKL